MKTTRENLGSPSSTLVSLSSASLISSVADSKYIYIHISFSTVKPSNTYISKKLEIDSDMYKMRTGGAMAQVGYVETDPSGRYGRFKDVLGRGAMKIVYRAFDELLGIEVAWSQVKLADVFQSPDQLQRLYSEVHLLKNLDHDSIMTFYASWIDVNHRTFNFITELFTSGTLREYRKKYQRVDMRAVKNWARQILLGLEYLHSHDPPVIHRDLKCDNIFVNGHLGQVKIGDLGLAAILRASHHAHSVIGTPEFMAPELYEEDYNELVDVYSFGMCMIEMLTSEFPYSECSNPAQIYKKVTSGKLPNAFYRIEDLEAQRFVGKCLANVSKRLPAKELLLDPFLATDQLELPLPLPIPSTIQHQKSNFPAVDAMENPSTGDQTKSTKMTITGTLNEEDDTVYLKVQISDKNGNVRNIYFPFDIINDTAIAVALEMVKELEIMDLEPFEIAEMIGEEILALVPTWKDWGKSQYNRQHSFAYEDEDDISNHHDHPFFLSASSPSSSQASLPVPQLHQNQTPFAEDWLQDELFMNDDESSSSSMNSFKYVNLNYSDSGYEDEHDQIGAAAEHIYCSPMTTRFCPRQQEIETNFSKKFSNLRLDYCITCHGGCPRLRRMRSYLDVRSQQLQRSLMEQINKRRMFKTVGAIENIGFQHPNGSSCFSR